MVIFGAVATYICIKAFNLNNPFPELAVIEMLIIVIMIMFIQIIIQIRVYEFTKYTYEEIKDSESKKKGKKIAE